MYYYLFEVTEDFVAECGRLFVKGELFIVEDDNWADAKHAAQSFTFGHCEFLYMMEELESSDMEDWVIFWVA